LRTYECRIPFSNYGDSKFKPFFGVLFEVSDLYYITQISHAQKRHYKIKEAIDFYKIYHPNQDRLLSVINLNYMFPIPKSEIYPLEYKNIEECRTFEDDSEKSKYINLLKTEIKEINKRDFSVIAKDIYNKKYLYPDSALSKRCLDYKKLESIALQWGTET